ncbi:MAG: MaoC family dehydratase N-terminal domain-containing protein [Acidimicrobiales bacterium]
MTDETAGSADEATDIRAVKAEWVGHEFERAEFRIDGQRMLDWAAAVGETDPRFTDPDHPDFQAHPAFPAQFGPRHMLPKNFPAIGNTKRGMDGGKAIELHRPIRAGDVLTAASELADVYEKTGRSGTMIFIVHRMSFTNQAGEPVATVDWRMMRPAS